MKCWLYYLLQVIITAPKLAKWQQLTCRGCKQGSVYRQAGFNLQPECEPPVSIIYNVSVCSNHLCFGRPEVSKSNRMQISVLSPLPGGAVLKKSSEYQNKVTSKIFTLNFPDLSLRTSELYLSREAVHKFSDVNKIREGHWHILIFAVYYLTYFTFIQSLNWPSQPSCGWGWG